jgi:hypothetical protein
VEDEEAVSLNEKIKENGLERTLTDMWKVSSDRPLVQSIIKLKYTN